MSFSTVSRDHLKILKTPFNISEMDEAALIKFGKWIDYSKSHVGIKNSPKEAWSLSRDPF